MGAEWYTRPEDLSRLQKRVINSLALPAAHNRNNLPPVDWPLAIEEEVTAEVYMGEVSRFALQPKRLNLVLSRVHTSFGTISLIFQAKMRDSRRGGRTWHAADLEAQVFVKLDQTQEETPLKVTLCAISIGDSDMERREVEFSQICPLVEFGECKLDDILPAERHDSVRVRACFRVAAYHSELLTPKRQLLLCV